MVKMFHTLLRKLGMERTVAAILMIVVGALILAFPNLLERLIATYLIIVGIVKLISD